MTQKFIRIAAALGAVLSMTLLAAAANDNPITGDSSGQYMWIVLTALGVSLLVIVIIAVTSGKKK